MNRALLKKIFKLTNFSDELSVGAALVYSIGEMRQGWDDRGLSGNTNFIKTKLLNCKIKLAKHCYLYSFLNKMEYI